MKDLAITKASIEKAFGSIEFRGKEILKLQDSLAAHQDVIKELKHDNAELLESIKKCLKAVDRGHGITAYSELEKAIEKYHSLTDEA